MEINIIMYVTKYAINVVLSLTSVPSTKHGNAVPKRRIIQKHLSAAKEVSAFCTITTEMQMKPDAAVIELSFLTDRFAVKVSFFFSFSSKQKLNRKDSKIQ